MIAIVLLLAGVLGLVYGGFSYATQMREGQSGRSGDLPQRKAKGQRADVGGDGPDDYGAGLPSGRLDRFSIRRRAEALASADTRTLKRALYGETQTALN